MTYSQILPSTTYNLVDSPWVSCSRLDGTQAVLSLREVFDQASQLSRVAGESPLQATAVLRVLLTIFWRSHIGHGELAEADPSDWWAELFVDEGDFSGPVDEYLEQHRTRFDLINSPTPFMQVAGLQKKDGSFDEASRLIPEAESEYFTLREGPGKERLGLPEAARWLVAVQAYDYSGIKPGAVGDPRVKGGKGYPIGPGWAGQAGLVVLHGRTLQETLLLNTPVMLLQTTAETGKDLPVWERAVATAEPRYEGASTPTGPCDVLTWQSRRIRLHLTGDAVTGVLISNGDKIENKNQFADPMTAYRYSRNQSSKAKQVFMAQEHDEAMTAWRSLAPLLSRQRVVEPQRKGEPIGKQPQTLEWLHELKSDRQICDDTPVSIELVGAVYGAQQSSVTNTISTSLPFALAFLLAGDTALDRAAVEAAAVSMGATVALGQFAGGLLQAAGADYEFRPEPRAAVLHRLEIHFRQWLLRLVPGTDSESHSRSWQRRVRHEVITEAQALLRSANPRAYVGRLEGDEKPRLISASTLWNRLNRRLDEQLPLTSSASSTPAQEAEHVS